MLAEISWQLGAGALLGWAALPLLVRIARRSRHAAPAAYYRALVSALGIAAALSFAPLLRGLLGVGMVLPLSPQPWGGVAPITLVADWVSPLVGSRSQPWSSMPLAQALSALGLLWLGVIGLGCAKSLVGRLRLARVYRAADAAPARVLERAARVAAELGIALPTFRVADGVASAFTFGVFAPVVVLGRAACAARDEELDFLLRHELTHVARRDARAAFWIELAERCFSGHPCLRALAREIRFAREAAVDETAAGPHALEYARFLLRLAEQVDSLRAPQSSLVSMADTALERRIEMLMSEKQPRRGLGASWLGLSGLVLGALVFLAPSSFGQSGDAPKANQTTVKGNLSVAQAVFPAPSSGTVQVDMPTLLTPPLEERNARAETEEAGSPRPGTPENAGAQGDRRGAVQVSGRLHPEVIRKVVRDSYAGFRGCYEALGQPLPETTAKLHFTIGLDGKVTDGKVESEEYPELGKCIDPVMRAMVFPAPKGGIVTVGYPILFAPG